MGDPGEPLYIDPRLHAGQDVIIEHWLSIPPTNKPSHVVKQLRGAVAQIETMGARHLANGKIDAGLRDRFTQLADALRNYDEESKEKKRKKSVDGEQPSAKRSRGDPG